MRVVAHGVALLDGGLAKWKAEGRGLEMGKQTLRHRHFTEWRDAKAVRTKEQMLANVGSGAEQVVDARPAARFTGDKRDPRPGIAPVPITNSRRLPHGALFTPDGTWTRGDDLQAEPEPPEGGVY